MQYALCFLFMLTILVAAVIFLLLMIVELTVQEIKNTLPILEPEDW